MLFAWAASTIAFRSAAVPKHDSVEVGSFGQ